MWNCYTDLVAMKRAIGDTLKMELFIITKIWKLSKCPSTDEWTWCGCCSVAQLCPTLCDPMDGSTPDLSVPHHLPKFAQVHVHCTGDAIQPSHPLTPSSASALNLFQHIQYTGLYPVKLQYKING